MNESNRTGQRNFQRNKSWTPKKGHWGTPLTVYMNIIMEARYLFPNFIIRTVGREDLVRFKQCKYFKPQQWKRRL